MHIMSELVYNIFDRL